MMEDAAHADASDEFAWVFVHGPRAAELARDVPAVHGGYGGAVDTTGLGGGVIVVPAANADGLGATTWSSEGRVEGSREDWEALRVERFLPRFGVDFGEKNYPQEASLEKIAVSFSKGCYLGQEVVCRLEMRGHVIKKLVPVRLDRGEPPAPGAEVQLGRGQDGRHGLERRRGRRRPLGARDGARRLHRAGHQARRGGSAGQSCSAPR